MDDRTDEIMLATLLLGWMDVALAVMCLIGTLLR